MHRSLFVVLISACALVLGAPATALAAGGETHRSSNWPWITGIIVLLVLAGAAAAMRLRRR